MGDEPACRIAIFALVKELAHSSMLLRGLAHLQLRGIAAHKKKTFYSLVSPYLADLACFAASTLIISPVPLHELCRLLGLTPRDFFLQTLQHTLPSFTVQQQDIVLARIAEQVGSNVTTLLVKNAAAVLAQTFLSKDSEKIFAFVQHEVEKGSGKKVEAQSIVHSCLLLLVCELVSLLGDTELLEGREAVHALEKVQRVAASAVTTRSARTIHISKFLQPHLLGIVTHLSELLHDVRGKKSMQDKILVLKSLGSFVKIVGEAIHPVAQQVMAMLQSVMFIDDLSEAAVKAWNKFVHALAPRDLGPHVGPISAILVTSWYQLSPDAQKSATQTLEFCIIDNKHAVRQHLGKVVDLEGIPQLARASRTLAAIRQTWTRQEYLDGLLRRCTGGNIAMTRQSLLELKKYITARDYEFLNSVAAGDVFDPVIARIIDALVSATLFDGEDAESIHLLAFEILGIVGALDPDRFDSQPRDALFVMIHNFEDQDEGFKFACHLIQELLVPAFRSTGDPRFQTSVGYALQELSKYCGFVAEVDSLSVHNVVRARWDGLSQAAQETTTPFLGAKFVVQTKPQADISLPIYPSQSSYREWLQTWVAHLITRVSSEPARLVFSACRGAVRGNDARVALHLLPHLVLHVLIGGTEDDCSWIRAEIVAVLEDVVDRSSESRKDRRVFSAQTTFSLLDHLNTWVRCARQHEARAETRKQRRSTTSTALKNRIVAVDSVLSAIDRDLMAKAAFQCQAYARALMNLEQQVTDRRDAGLTTDSWLRDYYERMHEIYSLVDEPDGMEGIATLIVSPSMEMQIRQHESTGKWTAAQSCWEVKLQRAPDELNLHLGLLRCLRNLGHYDTLRTHIQGILTRNPDWRDHLVSLQLESAWIVGAWDEVERGLSSAPAHLPETAVSRMLLSVRSKDEPSIQAAFAAARLELGAPISTSNRGSYRQSYNALMGLHAVHELQLVHGSSSTAHLLEVTSPTGQELQRRFDSLLPTFRIQETALNMRRTFLELRIARESRGTVATDSPSMQTIGQTWLLTAKIARKAGHHQTAYSAILQAQQHQTSFAFVQNCKLVKENGETLRALEELTAELNRLQDVVERRTSDDAGVSLNDYDRRQLSKAMVLRARWMPETARFGYNDISKQFTAAIASESAYFHYGFYQDDYFKSLAGSADAWSWNIRTVQNYAKSLEYGSKYIYQTMPRMLTLWLDHAEDPTINMKAYHKMHGAMQLAQHRIAVYKWLTAFPQIVSRVDHKNDMAFKVLNTIMRNVITGYPHQGLWAFMSVWNSNHTLRRKRGDSLLRNMMNRDAEMKQLIAVSSSMAKELLKLCDLDVQAIPNPSLKSHIPGLAKLMTTSPKLILPFQDSLTPTMPPRGLDGASHQPFPPDLPTIIGFEDEVEVMKSLAKPRRLTIIASNGQRYMMMAKPKDDLRKDARLMDFNTIINKLLKKNSDSRRRQLHIRTYSVITLNEECGLIQWVPNVMPVRHILEKLYKAQGKQIYPPDVLLLYGRLKDLVNMSDVDAIDAFKVKLLDAYKPVLHEWFIDTFPDPSAWLASRLAFSRTCAVMSIIGAMLGLGDRHSENILLDTVSGDLIHVDFNCLFDKGKLLEQAEKVPFRLTHNIVDALGVTGVEGVFRTTCEIVMELLRDYNDCLMNVLDAFVHDPLVEWEDEKKRRDRMAHRQRQGQAQHLRSSSVMEEDVKRVAKQAMENIAMRLSGRLPPNQTIISPADQVAALISAASAPVNLCRMFYGWAPHL
ncbi:hypothetical protein BKA62DRAFT_809018 [Auriculariales sp. MPI-PUGE-AT-0066]|nr:hypothetical protein BKA62DRAFT_809018 [Auriculariales sp. MPI-PUGE-AT-0066]